MQKLEKDKNILKQVDINYCLNDNGDILVRLKPKKTYIDKRIKKLKDLAEFDGGNHGIHDKINECSLFYYEGNEINNDYGHYLYYDNPFDKIKDLQDLQGVSMNLEFIFFWN